MSLYHVNYPAFTIFEECQLSNLILLRLGVLTDAESSNSVLISFLILK